MRTAGARGAVGEVARDQHAARAPVGVTVFEWDETAPNPTEFLATTVNEYAVPFLRCRTVHEVVAVEQVRASGRELTV